MGLGPRTVAGYTLHEELGRGGFASVHRATDPSGRQVALKVLLPGLADDDELQRRFAREAELVSKLQNPHTVRLYAHGVDGVPWAAFELVPGQDLAELLAQRGRLTVGEVRHILLQVAESLAEAHSVGVIHRDLKPENIRVFPGSHGDLTVKVLDFGIARSTDAAHPAMTKTGELIGTPRYMSPEQLRGDRVTGTSDIYTLGLMAYELIAGRDALPANVLIAQLDRVVDDFDFALQNPTAEELELLAVVRRMANSDPSRRPQSMAALRGLLTRSPGLRTTVRPPPTARRPPWLAIGMVLVALATAVAVVVAGRPDEPEPRPVVAEVPRTNPLVVVAEEQPSSPDAGANEGSKNAIPDFCARGPRSGAVQFKETEGSADVFVAEHFDPTNKPIVLALFRGRHEPPDAFMDYMGFREVAERENVLIVFPNPLHFALGKQWDIRYWEKSWTTIQKTMLEFCVSENASLLLAGQGLGARMVDEIIRHRAEQITAAGVTAIRYEDRDPNVSGTAYVDFSQRRDAFSPADGGLSVSDDGPFNSIAQRFDYLKSSFGCSDEFEVVFEKGESRCRRWSCDNPLQLCELDTGRYWKRDVEGISYTDHAGYGDDLPQSQIMWEFFLHAIAQRDGE